MPDCCLVKPVTTSSSVVLPAPFGPMSPTTSPGVTVNETSSTATTPPNRTVIRLHFQLDASTRVAQERHRPAARRHRDRVRLKKRANRFATSEAVPSGARRSSWTTPMALKIAIHAATLSRFGKISLVICSAIAARRGRGSGDRARDPSDAADDGVLHEQDRTEHVEVRELHASLAEPEEDAADCGDPGADRERVDLDAGPR